MSSAENRLDISCELSPNILVEKLDETVTDSQPKFYHAGTTLEPVRFALTLNTLSKSQQVTK